MRLNPIPSETFKVCIGAVCINNFVGRSEQRFASDNCRLVYIENRNWCIFKCLNQIHFIGKVWEKGAIYDSSTGTVLTSTYFILNLSCQQLFQITFRGSCDMIQNSWRCIEMVPCASRALSVHTMLYRSGILIHQGYSTSDWVDNLVHYIATPCVETPQNNY